MAPKRAATKKRSQQRSIKATDGTWELGDHDVDWRDLPEGVLQVSENPCSGQADNYKCLFAQ
jgi:hypothetical protein